MATFDSSGMTSIPTTVSHFQTFPPDSPFIAMGWLEQLRRSKLSRIWKKVLVSLVKGPVITTLRIQRQMSSGTSMESLHQFPVPSIQYVDLVHEDTMSMGENSFVIRMVSEDILFRCPQDKDAVRKWIATLRMVGQFAQTGSIPNEPRPRMTNIKQPQEEEENLISFDQDDKNTQTNNNNNTNHQHHNTTFQTFPVPQSHMNYTSVHIPPHHHQQQQQQQQQQTVFSSPYQNHMNQGRQPSFPRQQQQQHYQQQQQQQVPPLHNWNTHNWMQSQSSGYAMNHPSSRLTPPPPTQQQQQQMKFHPRVPPPATTTTMPRAVSQPLPSFSMQQRQHQSVPKSQPSLSRSSSAPPGIQVSSSSAAAAGTKPAPRPPPQQQQPSSHSSSQPNIKKGNTSSSTGPNKNGIQYSPNIIASTPTQSQIKQRVTMEWALRPPAYQCLREISQLISSLHKNFALVSHHDYLNKWTITTILSKTNNNNNNNHQQQQQTTELDKAIRKVRFFLHPDKLPRDLNSDQAYLLKLLWDIINDAWEEYKIQLHLLES